MLGEALSSLTIAHDAEVTSLAYQHFSPNAVAAMPSLHAATPTLLTLILTDLRGWRYAPVLVYPAVGGIAWMYLGEHYLVDVLVGWLFGIAAFFILWVFPSRVVSRRRAEAVAGGLTRVLVPRRVPAWPLAAGALAIGAYAWINPLVGVPLQRVGGGTQDVQLTGVTGESVSLFDRLGLVSCDAGPSTTLVPDVALLSLVDQYAGFIQGFNGNECLTFTVARGFEPLSPRLIAFVQERVPLGSAMALESSRRGARLYVASGLPSIRFMELTGSNDDQQYLVVLRVAPRPENPAIHDVLRQVTSVVFRAPIESIPDGLRVDVPDASGS